MKKLSMDLLKRKIKGQTNYVDGVYIFDHPKISSYIFQVIASTGLGWDHVSVTIMDKKKGTFVKRTPTWQEMCFIKDLFFDKDETVVQFHPAHSNYVNIHEYCLHLWKPNEAEFPTPKQIMV